MKEDLNIKICYQTRSFDGSTVCFNGGWKQTVTTIERYVFMDNGAWAKYMNRGFTLSSNAYGIVGYSWETLKTTLVYLNFTWVILSITIVIRM